MGATVGALLGLTSITITVWVTARHMFRSRRATGFGDRPSAHRFRYEKLLHLPFGWETVLALWPDYFVPDLPDANDDVFDERVVRDHSRCYAHAVGLALKLPRPSASFGWLARRKQPGAELFQWNDLRQDFHELRFDKLRQIAVSEGLVPVSWMTAFQRRRGRGLVLLVADPSSDSLYFFKLTKQGWRSKAGVQPVSDTDDRDKAIRNPRLAVLDIHRYVPVGAFVVPYHSSGLRKDEADRRGIAVEHLPVH